MGKAILLLEDGTVFRGRAFGTKGQACGEVVFNTSMAGYQEILTDPSYHEQIITMTYPLIGNYGTNPEDVESSGVYARGFVVKENCPYASNWRSQDSLNDFLIRHDIVGLEGIDTRMLVRHIREKGAMKGIISTAELRLPVLKKQLEQYPGLVGRDIVKDVTSKKPFDWQEGVIDIFDNTPRQIKPRFKVVAFDFGIKTNILRLLYSFGCDLRVVPAATEAMRVLALKPDGVFLSNGPGDPDGVDYAIKTTRQLLGKVPLFGICLGQQILALALGGRTYKLKFGHHGANHPVKNLMNKGKIEITSQNHGFCVDIDTLKDKDVEITHLNLNDQTLEGFRCKNLPAFCVQYHPEASPGPHDSIYLFEEFLQLMQRNKK